MQYFLHINEVAEGQFDKSTTLDITNGQDTIALPSDFFTIKVLFKKMDTQYRPLTYRNNMIEPYDNVLAVTNSEAYEPLYYLRGNNIILRPAPGFSETAGLLLEYTAFPDQLLFGGDAMSAGISPVFRSLVVMFAVYKAKLKDDMVSGGNTADKAMQHLSDLYKNFKHQVSERAKYPQYILPWDI